MIDLSRLSMHERVMVFAPHPDDEVLACGGLLQRASAALAAVRVVFVTDGENNPWPQRVFERRLRLGTKERARWGRLRRREALAALGTLGVCEGLAWFLGFPDQGVTGALMTCADTVVSTLQDLLRTWSPSIVIAPSLQDLHPDHSAFMVLLMITLRRLVQMQQSAPALVSYVVHGTARQRDDDILLPLSDVEVETKRRALLCHQSQVTLSRRRLMPHVTAVERFHEERDGPTASFQDLVPIHTGPLDLGAWAWKDWIKPPLVRVVADDGECRAWTRRLSVANRGALAMPASKWPVHAMLFLKRERRWAFFDERGWEARVPASGSRADSPSRARARIVCVVPCYDVARYCEPILLEAAAIADCVVAVDDGSRDGTPQILARLAAAHGDKLRVLTLPENCGKGVALLTGLRFAIERFEFDAVVTLDSDGQHRPADVPRLAAAVRAGADFALGARALDEMPLRSRIGNRLSALVLRAFVSNAPHDTQCGLRALSRTFAEDVVAFVTGGRYETEARMLLCALERGVAIRTVPIPTLYSPHNASSHYRPLRDSIRILRTFARWRLERPGWQQTTRSVLDAHSAERSR